MEGGSAARHDPWAASSARERAKRRSRSLGASHDRDGEGSYRRLALSAKKVARKEMRKIGLAVAGSKDKDTPRRRQRGRSKGKRKGETHRIAGVGDHRSHGSNSGSTGANGVRDGSHGDGAVHDTSEVSVDKTHNRRPRASSMRRRSRSASATLRVRFQVAESPDSISPTPLRRRLKLTPRTGKVLSSLLPTPIASVAERALNVTPGEELLPTPSASAAQSSRSCDDPSIPPPPPTPLESTVHTPPSPDDFHNANKSDDTSRLISSGSKRLDVILPTPPVSREHDSSNLSKNEGLGIPVQYGNLVSGAPPGTNEIFRIRKQTERTILALDHRSREPKRSGSDMASKRSGTHSSSLMFTSRSRISPRTTESKKSHTSKKTRKGSARSNKSSVKKYIEGIVKKANAKRKADAKIRKIRKRQQKAKKDSVALSNTSPEAKSYAKNKSETRMHQHRKRLDDSALSAIDNLEGDKTTVERSDIGTNSIHVDVDECLDSPASSILTFESDTTPVATNDFSLDHKPLAEEQQKWSRYLRFSHRVEGSRMLSTRSPHRKKGRRTRSLEAKSRKQRKENGSEDFLPYAPLITSAMLLRSRFGQRRRDFISWDAHHARRYATIKSHIYHDDDDDGGGYGIGSDDELRLPQNKENKQNGTQKRRRRSKRRMSMRMRRIKRDDESLDGLGRAPSASYGIQSPLRSYAKRNSKRRSLGPERKGNRVVLERKDGARKSAAGDIRYNSKNPDGTNVQNSDREPEDVLPHVNEEDSLTSLHVTDAVDIAQTLASDPILQTRDKKSSNILSETEAKDSAESSEEDMKSSIRSIVSLSKISHRLFASGKSLPRSSTMSFLEPDLAATVRRPRSPPPARFRNINMSYSDALTLVEIPIVAPGRLTGRVDGYPLSPSIEEQLAACRLRVERTSALIHQRWASIHAARVILKGHEESPRRNDAKNLFLDTLANVEQARALWLRLRELVRVIKKRERRERQYRRKQKQRGSSTRFRGQGKIIKTLGFRGASGSEDLDTLKNKVLPRMRARLSLFALKHYAEGCRRRRRLCLNISARFRLLNMLRSFSVLRIPSLQSRAKYIGAVKMRRIKLQNICRRILNLWNIWAAERKEKRVRWSSALRVFLFRSQWRAMQGWRAAVTKMKASRIHSAIARQWYCQRLMLTVVFEWSKIARKQSMMRERIRLLQRGFISGKRLASTSPENDSNEVHSKVKATGQNANTKQIRRSSRTTMPKLADAAVAVAASLDKNRTSREKSPSTSDSETESEVEVRGESSSLADEARKRASKAALELEKEWRDTRADLTRSNNVSTFEKLRRKSLLLATKSVFEANRLQLQRRMSMIANEAEKLSSDAIEAVKADQEKNRRVRRKEIIEVESLPATGTAAASKEGPQIQERVGRQETSELPMWSDNANEARGKYTSNTQEKKKLAEPRQDDTISSGPKSAANATDKEDLRQDKQDKSIAQDGKVTAMSRNTVASHGNSEMTKAKVEMVQNREIRINQQAKSPSSFSKAQTSLYRTNVYPSTTFPAERGNNGSRGNAEASTDAIESALSPNILEKAESDFAKTRIAGHVSKSNRSEENKTSALLRALTETASGGEDSPSPIRYHVRPSSQVAEAVTDEDLNTKSENHAKALVFAEANFNTQSQEEGSSAQFNDELHQSSTLNTFNLDHPVSPISLSMATVFDPENSHDMSLGSIVSSADSEESSSSSNSPEQDLMFTLASLFASKSRLRNAFMSIRKASRVFKAARLEKLRNQREVVRTYFHRGFVVAMMRSRKIKDFANCLHSSRVIRRMFRTWRKNVLKHLHSIHMLHVRSILQRRFIRWFIYCIGRKRRRFCASAASNFRNRSLKKHTLLVWKKEADQAMLLRFQCDALRWRVLRRNLLLPALKQWKEVHRRRGLLFRVFSIAYTPSSLEVWRVKEESELMSAEAMKQAWFDEWAHDLGPRDEVFIGRQEKHGLVELDEKFSEQFHLMSKVIHAWKCYARGRAAWSHVLLRAEIFAKLRVYKILATSFLAWQVLSVLSRENYRYMNRVFTEWAAIVREANFDRQRLIDGFKEYWGGVRKKRVMNLVISALRSRRSADIHDNLKEMQSKPVNQHNSLRTRNLSNSAIIRVQVPEVSPTQGSTEGGQFEDASVSSECSKQSMLQISNYEENEVIDTRTDASTDVDISWADIEEEAATAFTSIVLGDDMI